MNIGIIIYNRRKELKLTLEQIGDYVGVGKSTVKKWESGYIANIKRDKIAKLAEILQLNPLTLIDGNIDDSKKENSPAKIDEGVLDEYLIRRLCSLSPEELAQVDAFVQGLLANRKA